MDSPPSCSLSATGALSDLSSSGLGGSISSDSVRAYLTIEVIVIRNIVTVSLNLNNYPVYFRCTRVI